MALTKTDIEKYAKDAADNFAVSFAAQLGALHTTGHLGRDALVSAVFTAGSLAIEKVLPAGPIETLITAALSVVGSFVPSVKAKAQARKAKS